MTIRTGTSPGSRSGSEGRLSATTLVTESASTASRPPIRAQRARRPLRSTTPLAAAPARIDEGERERGRPARRTDADQGSRGLARPSDPQGLARTARRCARHRPTASSPQRLIDARAPSPSESRPCRSSPSRGTPPTCSPASRATRGTPTTRQVVRAAVRPRRSRRSRAGSVRATDGGGSVRIPASLCGLVGTQANQRR